MVTPAVVEFEGYVEGEESSSESSRFCQRGTGNLPVIHRDNAAHNPTPDYTHGDEQECDPLTERRTYTSHALQTQLKGEIKIKLKTWFINCKICNISLVSQCQFEVHLRVVKHNKNERCANYTDSENTCGLYDIRFIESRDLQVH